MEKIAVIIPAFNEESAIQELIDQVYKVGNDTNLNIQVVVINDCSTDRTLEIISRQNCIVLDLPINLGIGGAVQCGYKYAFQNGYDLAVRIDGDGQHPPTEIPKLLDAYKNGQFDVLIGSRFLERTGFQSSFIRRIGIRYFQLANQLFAGTKVTDCTSGFRLLNRKAMKISMEYYPDEYPEAESIILFAKKGLKVGEVPIVMKERQGGTSSIDNFSSLYYLFKVSLAIFFTFIRLTISK